MTFCSHIGLFCCLYIQWKFQYFGYLPESLVWIPLCIYVGLHGFSHFPKFLYLLICIWCTVPRGVFHYGHYLFVFYQIISDLVWSRSLLIYFDVIISDSHGSWLLSGPTSIPPCLAFVSLIVWSCTCGIAFSFSNFLFLSLILELMLLNCLWWISWLLLFRTFRKWLLKVSSRCRPLLCFQLCCKILPLQFMSWVVVALLAHPLVTLHWPTAFSVTIRQCQSGKERKRRN